jgi:hypothetical protein
VAPLIALDDVRARDPRVAGAKAAGLAGARTAGLPVLPGWVVPADVAAASIRAGADALARRSHAAAILATSGAALDDATTQDLTEAVVALGGRVIVRSSTPVDADPRWAGGFATYEDVGPDEAPGAVRGCWASAFTRDVLGRCHAMGVEPGGLGIAVLIQPWIRFDARGTAAVGEDGEVRVETLTGTRADGGTPAVEELARSARRATGCGAIEWGIADGSLALLQVRRRSTGRDVAGRSPRAPARSFPPIAERLAEVAAAFPGPLGDAWVLPWALAVDPSPPPTLDVADTVHAVREARALAAELTARAWGDPAEAAVAIRAVLGPSPDGALGRLAALRPVDGAGASRLLGLVAGLERLLRRRGAIGRSASVWRLTPDELARAAGGDAPPSRRRLGPGRWEPFVHAVVHGNGRALTGEAASPGLGAGRVRILRGPDARWRPDPRAILVAPDALAQVAPFLWGAAGLVTSAGASGAHLFEVARSLGVPAATGVAVPDDADGRLASVDGDVGAVSILEPSAWARSWA